MIDLSLQVEVFLILGIVGHSRSRLVWREDVESFCEPWDVLGPCVCAGMSGPAFAVHQQQHLALARLVVAGSDAVDVHELGFEAGHLAVGRHSGLCLAAKKCQRKHSGEPHCARPSDPMTEHPGHQREIFIHQLILVFHALSVILLSCIAGVFYQHGCDMLFCFCVLNTVLSQKIFGCASTIAFLGCQVE